MAKTSTTLIIEYSATLTLNEMEMRALDALVGYGYEAFIDAFKNKLGTHYIRDHVEGLKSFFKEVREQILPELRNLDELRKMSREFPNTQLKIKELYAENKRLRELNATLEAMKVE